MKTKGEAMEEQNNYLGIDWGAAVVGLAYADSETRVACALTTIKNDARLLEHIAALVRVHRTGTIVIGVTTHALQSHKASPGKKLGVTLGRHLPGIQIVYEDELFTSKMAQRNLAVQGVRGGSHQDDAEAARIILQEWLDHGQAGFAPAPHVVE